MITLDQVAAKIRNKAKGHLGPDQVLDAETKLDDLGLSSLQVAEIVFELEEENGVEFDPGRAANVKTLGQLIDLGNQIIAGDAAPIAGSTVSRQ